MYLIHSGINRTETIIRKHLYWYGIIKDVQKEVICCNTCQRTKWSDIKYGKLPAKVAEEIPRNKLCVDIKKTTVYVKRERN